MSNLPWHKLHPQCITLDIKVKPASRQNELFVNTTGVLVVSLQAVAEDGRANKMLIKFLAKVLRIQQKTIAIHRGAVSRIKVISIAATPGEQNRIIELINQSLLGPLK